MGPRGEGYCEWESFFYCLPPRECVLAGEQEWVCVDFARRWRGENVVSQGRERERERVGGKRGRKVGEFSLGGCADFLVAAAGRHY